MDIRDMEVIDETLNALQYEVERGNYTKARLYAIGLNEVFEQSDINDCIEARLEENTKTEHSDIMDVNLENKNRHPEFEDSDIEKHKNALKYLSNVADNHENSIRALKKVVKPMYYVVKKLNDKEYSDDN